MLSSQLKRMYDAEFSECLASSKLASSGEDRRALTILENSARLVDGHYQLALPRPPSLKNNCCVALRRLHLLEKRFQKDLSLMEKYCKTMNEYIAKGHPGKSQMIRSIPVANLCGTCRTTRLSVSTNLEKGEWYSIAQLDLAILH